MNHMNDEGRLLIGAAFMMSLTIAVLVVLPYVEVAALRPPTGLKAYSDEALRGRHLYQPRAYVKDSIMPSYRYLFEIKPKAGPNDKVVQLPAAYQPKDGVVVASAKALDLVAYLLALDHTYPIDNPPRLPLEPAEPAESASSVAAAGQP